MTKVRNTVQLNHINLPKGYDSWLDYWEKESGENVEFCGACGCTKCKMHGAFVQKSDGSDDQFYITPLCNPCSRRTGDFEVKTTLVPAPF